jgi:CHAT domain-containing protein
VSENVILSDIFGEPDCLILNYFVGPNYTFVVSIFNNIIGASRINVGTTGLEDIIDRFRHDLQSPHNTLPGHVDGLELSKLLPDQALERDLDVVIVAPDGPLWRLPFDALPASAGPRSGDLVSGRANLIGDVAPVWITPTLRLFRRLRDRAALLPTTSECVLVVWRTRYAGFATIKQAEAEGAEVVSKARPRLVVHLAEADAIPEAVSRAMPKADIIHIATHAIVGSGDAPSAIVLSGPAGTDVFLSATEIAGLRLKAQVVFLSCCGSALGQASEGEGLVSVGRAFLFAGARCVIASIWPVEDQLTATFVGLFYDQLFGGDVPGIALHSARETLKNPAAGADIG